MLECPKCKSKKIYCYKEIFDFAQCNDCNYRAEEIKFIIKEKFKDIVENSTKQLNQDMRIDQMQNIRAKNNDNWMDLLRLAFKHDPGGVKEILQKITDKDKQISKICERIINE